MHFPLSPSSHSAKGSIVGQACYFPPTASGLVKILPRKRHARSMSLGMIVTHFACNAARLVSSNMPTICASEASWRVRTAKLWKWRSLLGNIFCVISRTTRWKGAFLINSSVVFWKRWISRDEASSLHLDVPIDGLLVYEEEEQQLDVVVQLVHVLALLKV